MSDPSPACSPPESDLSLSARPMLSLFAAAAIAVIAWLTFAAEVDITVARLLGRGGTLFDGLERVTNYLTNVTVFITAITFTCIVLPGRSRLSVFFRNPETVTAVAVYMVFVGLAYNLLLRGMWTPLGYRSLVNESQHSVLPVLVVVYWVLFVPRFNFSARICLGWLVYPLGYLFITLWRGANSHFYPYFFIDVERLGYPRVAANSTGLVLAFLILMSLFVLLNNRRKA